MERGALWLLLSGEEPSCQCRGHGWELQAKKTPGIGNATYSSILAWKISWKGEPCGYSPWSCKKVRYNLATKQQQGKGLL